MLIDGIDLRASRSAIHAHLAGSDGNPFITCGVEPGEPEGVLAVDVDMLAVGEPPSSFVVPGAVGVRNITVTVNRRKLHMVLIFERITSVSFETIHVQNISRVSVAHDEVVILRVPRATVDVCHINSHRCAIVSGKQMHRFESKPVFRSRIAETVNIFVKFPVEFNGSVVAALDERAAIVTPRVEGSASWMDEVYSCRTGDTGAVPRQLVDKILILTLNRLQFFHLTH